MADLTIGTGVELGIAGISDARLIGHGASANVYRAVQLEIDRAVAVKVLFTAHEEIVRRFQREAKALGRLCRHPGIVTVYDYGQTKNGHPYLIMQLCERSLDDQIRADGPLDKKGTIRATLDIVDAVSAAHEASVLHRDIKPANVLIDAKGNHLISDFGISALVDTTSAPTNGVGFTAGYAPPEVFASRPAPSRSADVYAIGATMVHMLTGNPPFFSEDDEGLMAVLGRVANEPPPDLRLHGASEDLQKLVEQVLSKSAEERPSIAEFGQELTRCLDLISTEEATDPADTDDAKDLSEEAVEEEQTSQRDQNESSVFESALSITPLSKTGSVETEHSNGRHRRLTDWWPRLALALVAAVVSGTLVTWWIAGGDDGADDAAGSQPEAPDARTVGGGQGAAGGGDGGSELHVAEEGKSLAQSDDSTDGADDPAEPTPDAADTDGAESPAGEDRDATDTTSADATDGTRESATSEDAATTVAPTTTGLSTSSPTTAPSATSPSTGLSTTSTSPGASSSSETTELTTTTTTLPPVTESTIETTTSETTVETSTSSSTPSEALTISGPQTVLCGVGVRTYTANTGATISAWSWTSPFRTQSPINAGPTLQVLIRGAAVGPYTISVNADGQTASIAVTVIPSSNCG